MLPSSDPGPRPGSCVMPGVQMVSYQQTVKWQSTHLNTGGARKLISCEKNVWLSSRYMQRCWWDDKGFLPTGFFLPCGWLDQSSGRQQLLIFKCGSKRTWKDNCDKLLIPLPRSDFSGRRGHFLGQNPTLQWGIQTITTPLHYQRARSPETYLLISFLSKINAPHKLW